MCSVLQVLLPALVLYQFFDYCECQALSKPAPQCYNTATCPCCKPGTCPSGRTGLCGGNNCLDGYHGGKCWNKCPANCVSCKDAPQGGGVATCTKCKDGYYSTSTQYQCQQRCHSSCKTCASSSSQCTSCNTGYYFTTSQCRQCDQGCNICTSSSSRCSSCKPGYYLIPSQNKCEQCNAHCHTCDSSGACVCYNGCNSDQCIENTGYCSYGCKPNFASTGTQTKCDFCVSGKYGNHCNIDCSQNCDSTCDRTTGFCSACKPKRYGKVCELQCPGNCLENCDKVSGVCDACVNGHHGNSCNLTCEQDCKECKQADGECTACLDGLYGLECNKNCSQHCIQSKCSRKDGSCECSPGYDGARCQLRITTTERVTTGITHLVVTQDTTQYIAPAVGGTVAFIAVIVAIVVGIVCYRRRDKYIRPAYELQLDVYKMDPSLTDVLEVNDEFEPIYFTGKPDDTIKPCGKLPVKELAKFVDSHGDDFYQEEFLKLPRGLIKSVDEAKKPENVVKNRYNGIYPYDEHRVKLLPPGSDFINACYMDGFNRKKEYIASLGPTIKAMENHQLFWRMVWQEKPDVIVMVTNLMEGTTMKCEQYWPDDGRSTTYGDVKVTSQSEEFYAEFVVRNLIVSRDREQRELHHVHYTAWPDKRVPDDITSLLELRQKVKTFKPVLGGPTIVHCSAGIGRTGTYIALDILIQQGKAQKALDIFDWVDRMREQRTSMVQTCEQYQYLHRALVHALTYRCEPIKAKKFQRVVDNTDDRKLNKLFKQLQQKPEIIPEHELEAKEINKGYEGLNRDGADIPGNQHKPLLYLGMRYGEMNYINATFLNSFTVKNRFLIAQTPLPRTVKDFLTLVTQEKCPCIVSMDPPNSRDQTIGEYYPSTPGHVFTHPSNVFEVEARELDTNTSYILRQLTIHFNQESGSTSRTVYHFQCQHWPQGNQVPNVSLFLQLVQDVEAMADRDTERGPVLVHCLNAAGRSGLFCAVSNLIQKMSLEGEVSVVNTLRQVKVRRPLAIPNKGQYMFCYQCVLHQLNTEVEHADMAIYGNI